MNMNMKIQPVIHHHFKFSKAILENTGHCKDITFENMPFFMLFESNGKEMVRAAIESLQVSMPHKYQKYFNGINIPKHLLDCSYRADIIPMTFCELNKQQFFVRAYYLRKNEFFKVEVTYLSKTLGIRKNYCFSKLVRSANKFFDFLKNDSIPLSPDLHLDEYFQIDDFKTNIEQWRNRLNIAIDCNTKKTKRLLIENLVKDLKYFEQNAKIIAAQRLVPQTPPWGNLGVVAPTTSICSNLAETLPLDNNKTIQS